MTTFEEKTARLKRLADRVCLEIYRPVVALDITAWLTSEPVPFAEGRVIEEAYALNLPLLTCPLTPAAGKLAATQAIFEIDRPGIVIESLKVSEDGEAVSVRHYEAFGGRGKAILKTALPVQRVWKTNLLEEKQNLQPFSDRTVELSFLPFEIITLRFECK